MYAFMLYGVGEPLRVICRFLPAKIRNIEKLMSAARTCAGSAAWQRHFINMQQATCECCALSSHPISPGLNQLQPSESAAPHRTALRQCHLMAYCVCVCACVCWLVYCGLCQLCSSLSPPPICICRAEYPLAAAAEYHPLLA